MKPKTLEHLLGEAAAKQKITVEDLCRMFHLNERTLRRLRRESTEVRDGTIAQLVLATGQDSGTVKKAIAASRRAIAERKAG